MCLSIEIVAVFSFFETSTAVTLGIISKADFTLSSQLEQVMPLKELIVATGLLGDLKNSEKPGIADIMDFGFLRNLKVDAFLIAGSNALQYPFETVDLITNFEQL